MSHLELGWTRPRDTLASAAGGVQLSPLRVAYMYITRCSLKCEYTVQPLLQEVATIACNKQLATTFTSRNATEYTRLVLWKYYDITSLINDQLFLTN